MISAILALSLTFAQTTTGPSEVALTTVRIAGNEVTAKVLQTGFALPSLKSTIWNGWTYYVNDKGQVVARSVAKGGWSDVIALSTASKAKINETTPVWKVKAVIFKRFDSLETSKEGVIRQRRSTLEASQTTAALESLARFAAVADALADGRFHVSLDVEIETETMRFGPSRGKAAFDSAFGEWYFGPRVNGGEFESEDKVYRGPYDSILYIHPGQKGDGEFTSIVNRTPISGVAFDPKEDSTQGQNLTVELLNDWVKHLSKAAMRFGCPLEPFARFSIGKDGSLNSTGTELLKSSLWGTASNRANASSKEYTDILSASLKGDAKAWTEVADDPLKKLPKVAFFGQNDDVTKPILLDKSSSNSRSKIGIPVDLAPFVGSHFKPELDAKAIGWMQAPSDSKTPGATYIVFEIGGQSTDTELLNLDQALTDVGDANVKDLPIPSDWKWNAQTPVPLFDLPEPLDQASVEAKALLATRLTEDSPQTEKAEVAGMLTARDDTLRINAAMAFTRVKDSSVETALIDLIAAFNTRVGEMALKALAFQGTPTAWAQVKRALENGRYDHIREAAAVIIGAKGDPKDAASVSTLLTGKSWLARLKAAEVIGSFREKTPGIILMTFLMQDDPSIRLAVTKLAQTQYELPARRLLWSSVNDVSDQVRAWSFVGLQNSTQASYQEEAWKGVRDSSIYVRLFLLDYMKQHPVNGNRTALRQAVADSEPEVRAMALEAFSKLPGEVTLDEIRNVLSDNDPRIQSALIELAIAKKLKLSQETVTALKSSIDPKVAECAKELP